MGIIVRFGRIESAGMESNGVDVTVGCDNRENGSQGIVGCVGFNYNLGIGYPMGKHRSRSESLLERIKGIAALIVKIPSGGSLGESDEGNDNVRIAMDETMIEVCET